MPQGMGRTVIGPEDRERGGPKGRTVEMRIGAAGAAIGAPFGAARGGSLSPAATVEDLVSPARGLSSLASLLSVGAAAVGGGGGGQPGSGAAAAQLDKERKRANELEREVETFQRELGRAANVNEAMWKKVVDSALSR